jgi:DnaJ-class molecular chaperone
MAKKTKKTYKTITCPTCRGAGKTKTMVGVGWNKDFWDTCSNCRGSGSVQVASGGGCQAVIALIALSVVLFFGFIMIVTF